MNEAAASTLTIHVQPRARSTRVVGRHGDAIRIAVAAPPVDGAANAELVRFLSETLRVPRRLISLAAGATGRRKLVRVAGIATAEAEERLLAVV